MVTFTPIFMILPYLLLLLFDLKKGRPFERPF